MAFGSVAVPSNMRGRRRCFGVNCGLRIDALGSAAVARFGSFYSGSKQTMAGHGFPGGSVMISNVTKSKAWARPAVKRLGSLKEVSGAQGAGGQAAATKT